MRKSIVFLTSLICFFVVCDCMAGDAAEEWIDIPVVVNIIDGSDGSGVADAIKKANEILGIKVDPSQSQIAIWLENTQTKIMSYGDGNFSLSDSAFVGQLALINGDYALAFRVYDSLFEVNPTNFAFSGKSLSPP